MKTTSSSRVLETRYHSGSHLLLFGKRKLQSVETSWE